MDLLARFGGDEFVALLADTDEAGALEVAARIERSIAASPFTTDRGSASVTASVGVAGACPPRSVAELLAAAGQVLYDAKAGGRSCVRIATPA